MANQLDLFGTSHNKVAPDNDSLFIVKDNKRVKMPVSELFDPNKYSEFRGVTFSASGAFISKHLSKFHKLYIIQGIHEGAQLADTYQHINDIQQNAKDAIRVGMFNDKHNLAELYKRLSTPIRKMMINRDFDLRVPITRVIHEKFYLLNNPKTHETRVIIGSANLSSQALNSHSNQSEGLMIFDNNSSLFKIMKAHFDELYQTTTTYITATLRHIASKQLKHDKSSKNPNKKEALTKKQAEQIRKSVAIQVKHGVQQKFASGQASPKLTLEAFKHVADRNPNLKRRLTRLILENTASADLVRSTINSRTKVPKFKSDLDINKGITKHLKKYHIHIYHFNNKAHKQTVSVPMVLDYPETRQINETSGLNIQNHGVISKLGNFGSKDEIKKTLLLINEFFKGIKKYGYDIDDEYLSRGMEAILYGFTAPFFGDIRNQIPESFIRGIHMFMFIGGQAHSGKTTLLKFIMQLLGYYPSPNAIRYDDIIPAGHNKKADTINAIRGWMESQYVTPIPVNEVTPDFFNKQQYGESLVLNVTGDFQEHPDQQFSALMGVTNSSSYNLSKRARTRCYYLNFGRHLNTNRASHVDDLMNMADDVLSNDFYMRFSNLLAKHVIGDTYPEAMYNNHFDFLYWTRKIFKNYYTMVGLKPPKYFPKHLYNDSQVIGARRWRNLYVSDYKNFLISHDGKTIRYNIGKLDKNSYSNTRSRAYANALPTPSVLISSPTEPVVEMRRNEFFNWIHLDEQQFREDKRNEAISTVAQRQNIHDMAEKRIKAEQHKNKKKNSFWYKLLHH